MACANPSTTHLQDWPQPEIWEVFICLLLLPGTPEFLVVSNYAGSFSFINSTNLLPPQRLWGPVGPRRGNGVISRGFVCIQKKKILRLSDPCSPQPPPPSLPHPTPHPAIPQPACRLRDKSLFMSPTTKSLDFNPGGGIDIGGLHENCGPANIFQEKSKKAKGPIFFTKMCKIKNRQKFRAISTTQERGRKQRKTWNCRNCGKNNFDPA